MTDKTIYHPGDHVFCIEKRCKRTDKNVYFDVIWPCELYCDANPRECEYYISEIIIGNQPAADEFNKSRDCYPTKSAAKDALEKYQTNL